MHRTVVLNASMLMTTVKDLSDNRVTIKKIQKEMKTPRDDREKLILKIRKKRV
jgi:DNA polymerase elongation subunit (family B)